ncbi:MAG: DUF4412 domain-containing protein [Gemmatimonadales bacterium]
MQRAALFTALFTLASVGSAPAQDQFEGVIVYRMSSDGRSMEMKISSRGEISRMELTQGPGRGMGYQLVDRAKGTATFVMPEQKMYMIVDLAEQAEAVAGNQESDPDFRIEATGKKETIAEHECEHFLVTTKDEKMDVCAATGLGFIGGFARNPMARGAATGPSIPLQYRQLAARFKNGFQPLKVERIKGDKREPVLEALSVARESLAADDFRVPAGFNKFEMPPGMAEMMKKMPKRPPR